MLTTIVCLLAYCADSIAFKILTTISNFSFSISALFQFSILASVSVFRFIHFHLPNTEASYTKSVILLPQFSCLLRIESMHDRANSWPSLCVATFGGTCLDTSDLWCNGTIMHIQSKSIKTSLSRNLYKIYVIGAQQNSRRKMSLLVLRYFMG